MMQFYIGRRKTYFLLTEIIAKCASSRIQQAWTSNQFGKVFKAWLRKLFSAL